jgi:GAF domain-containing protein
MSAAPGGEGPALPTRELEAIAEASRVLSSTLDLAEVLDRLAAIAQARLEVDVVRIWLVDEPGGTVLRSQIGTLKQEVGFSPSLPSGQGLVGWVIRHGQPLAVADAREDPRLVNRAWFQAEGVISILTVPIVLGGTPIGALACMCRRRREFSTADIALAEAVAAPAATAVRNATLYSDALARLEEIQGAQRVISPRS